MNFFTMQSLGTYTKNMEMQIKWKHKKATGDFTADGSTKLMDPTARQAEEIRLAQADGSAKMSSQIRSKLAAGKKLTWEEMEYLQKHDPQMYQKAKAIEEEQKSYEEDLRRCETKEDVERVRMNRVAASLSVVNSVRSNPAIPEGAKLGIIWQELMKNKAMEETISEFVKSGRYAQLPTEAEKRAAEKAIEEAKEAELGVNDSAENTENTESTKNTEQTNLDDTTRNVFMHETAQQSRTLLQEYKKTLAEAEATPEALKVKRAKARAAYKGSHVQISEQMYEWAKDYGCT